MASGVTLRPFGYAAIGAAIALMVFNSVRYNPARAERYTSPTFASFVIQEIMPSAYRPPVSIFTDRYGSGISRSNGPINLVLGPDCRRYTVRDVDKLTLPGGIAASFCRHSINQSRLAEIAKGKKTDQMDQWTYGQLSRYELRAIR